MREGRGNEGGTGVSIHNHSIGVFADYQHNTRY